MKKIQLDKAASSTDMPARKSTTDLHFPSSVGSPVRSQSLLSPSGETKAFRSSLSHQKQQKSSSSGLPHSSGKVPFKTLNPWNEGLPCLIHEIILMAHSWIHPRLHSEKSTGRCWEREAPSPVWKQPTRRDPMGRVGSTTVVEQLRVSVSRLRAS